MTERKPDNVLWDFPRLRDVTPEGSLFNFRCYYCKNNNIDLIPINISWKFKDKNNDLKDVLGKCYDRLPNKQEALLLAVQSESGILCVCNICKKAHQIFDHIERMKLTKWLETYGKKETNNS